MQVKPCVITSYTLEWISPKGAQILNVGEFLVKREYLWILISKEVKTYTQSSPKNIYIYILFGNVNWCGHCGKEYGRLYKT